MNLLRAIVRSGTDGKWFEAQLLELDIAVTAASMDDVFAEIEHAIVMEYHVSRQVGRTPFAAIAKGAPHTFKTLWIDIAETDPAIKTRELRLPDEVLEALAIALHSPNRPVLKAQRFALAA